MKKARVIYRETYTESPMSFWVHRGLDAKDGARATVYDPPLPLPVPGRGWAQLLIEFDGVELWFSSVHELDHFIEVMSKNPLPTTLRLLRLRDPSRDPDGYCNSHWLSRLPSRAKPLAFRRRLVVYLERVRPDEWR